MRPLTLLDELVFVAVVTLVLFSINPVIAIISFLVGVPTIIRGR